MPINDSPGLVAVFRFGVIGHMALASLLAFSSSTQALATGPGNSMEPPESVEVPVEVLQMRIKHLDVDELLQQANRWQGLLRETVRELNGVHEEVWRDNQRIEAVSDGPGDPAALQREEQRKADALERLAQLRERRVQVIDRLEVVLDDLSAKLGSNAEGEESEKVRPYRLYIDSVKELKLDVKDTESAWSTVVTWLKSDEGGVRLARHVAEFAAIVAGFWLLSLLLSRLAGKAVSLSAGASQILRKFVVDSVRRVTIIVGLLLGLAALEINITPLVAVIGAAGFVIAFALQNTLSNFASGLMIMFYKPFDIGDFVETASVSGVVQSMTLVTTNMLTPDNKLLVVPNNELWGKVITNVTGSSERRVDLVFGIGYGDDIAAAERVLSQILDAHPLVLEEPAPVIRVAELADSSVNLICRPWVKTSDYWTVYWDVTRQAKERFDAEGISIPFPQRDVHVHAVAGTGTSVAD